MEKKVTIEITENGWQTTVEIDGNTFIEKHERTKTGSRCVEGDFEAHEDMPDELWEAVSSGFYQHEIMKALYNN